MDSEKRLSNLENLVNALIKRIDLDKMYNNADLQGQRQSISNVDSNAKDGITTNSANIDYVAMMVDVEIPTEE